MEKHKRPVIDPLLLTVPQAARMLGISRNTLYRLFRRGELRHIHIGRAARVSVADLRRWLQAREQEEESRYRKREAESN